MQLDDKLTKNIKELEIVKNKVLENGKNVENAQSVTKLNNKIHSENYKALGRLI